MFEYKIMKQERMRNLKDEYIIEIIYGMRVLSIEKTIIRFFSYSL
jgi:hypothetical protein